MYTGAKPADGKRILVIRLGAMGDIILALPAVASLKHSIPGSRLAWAVEPRWAPLLEGNPFVDRVLVVDRSSGSALRHTWHELRSEPFDFAVDFQGLLKSAVVACAARPERIFGLHRSQVRERLAALFYSNQVLSRAHHATGRNLDLAAAAGAATIVQSFPLPPGRPEGSLPREFVLASPVSGWPGKQWPLEYYAILAQRLQRETGMTLVLNGPPSAREMLSGVPGAMLHISSLAGLIDATRRAAAVVGVDSGPMHLAAALGRPGVSIFGPTDPARNGPCGGSFTVLRSPVAVTSYKRRGQIDPSMRTISPETVFEALKPHLSRRHDPADCLA